ncbi:MAG: hypothetical protein AAFP83_10205 [Bacteroidota bacterium]
MKLVLRIIATFLMVSLLTLFTQVGGVIYLLCLPLFRWIHRSDRITRKGWVNFGSFFMVYLICTLFVIPPLAKKFSQRVPLPYFGEHVQALNIGYCLLNRHYVKPEMRTILERLGEKMGRQYPESIIAYMDANFPFWDGFRLLPHYSHKDGRKIDIALFYKDQKTGKRVHRKTPTAIGYGSSEGPRKGEYDRPSICEKQGYWPYTFMSKHLPPVPGRKLDFDPVRTQYFLKLLRSERSIRKVLIEPHLKARLGFGGINKFRFAGCKAVRHDDHLHLEI